MQTLERTTQKARESHMMNGSANLNYNFEQFSELPQDQKLHFLWCARVASESEVMHQQIEAALNEGKEKEIFMSIMSAKRKRPYYEREKKGVMFGPVEVFTAAQAAIVSAYGDSYEGIPFRCLNMQTECEDLTDAIRCIEIIKSYNEFDAHRIKTCMRDILNIQQWYSSDNCNNGKSPFRFKVGREGSPVLYVEWVKYGTTNVIKERHGADVEYGEYTVEEFTTTMQTLSNAMLADEFNIEKQEYGNGAHQYFTARFWWD